MDLPFGHGRFVLTRKTVGNRLSELPDQSITLYPVVPTVLLPFYRTHPGHLFCQQV